MSTDPQDAMRHLREQAQERLRHPAEAAPEPFTDDPATLLEELRLHQAELEVQNQELRRAQIEAQEAHRYYLTLFDSLPIVAFVIDANGLILNANRQACTLFGFRSSLQLRRHAMYRLLEAGSAQFLADWLHRVSDADEEPAGMLSAITPTGDVLDMEAHVKALPSTAAPDRRYLLLMVDRTSELASTEQNRLYEAIINHSNSLIYAFNHEYRCIVANDALLKFLNKPRDEVIGRLRAELMPETDTQEYDKNDALVIGTGEPHVFEEKLHVPGATQRYFLSHKFPLRDSAGHIYAVGGITTDMTQTREAAKRLELALQVFSQGTEGVMITNQNNLIVSVNRAFEQITGYSESEVLGKPPSILASGRHDTAFYANLWRHINEEGHWEGEIWNRRKNGEAYPEWLTISRVKSSVSEEGHYVGVFADITHRKLAEEEIERLAFYDSLTGLPNRYLLKDRVNQAIEQAQRTLKPFGLAFIDLDQFKEVNDLHGHEAGDELLREVVGRVRQHIRPGDTLARLGGDEFILMMADIPLQDTSSRLSTILRHIAEAYRIHGRSVHVSGSIGLAVFPDDGTDYDTLLKHADMAMYQAKADGRNTFRLFNADMAAALRAKYELDSNLRSALDRNEFHVVYQPQIDLKSGRLVGLEALLRWESHELGPISPDQFIPSAEQSGLIHTIGVWVLDQVCRQIVQWRASGWERFTVAINVSAKQFWAEDFVERIRLLLDTHQLPGERLEIELTERVAMQEAERAIGRMTELKALGIRLSIDDFGTGYSSFAYLRWMPVNMLKIDKSFVDDIGKNPDDDMICRSIINLAHGLNMTVLAEGVETQRQADFLLDNGCDLIQGYLFARPMTAEAVTQLLAR